MSRILCVGNAVLDYVLTVPHHPAEDEELRATALRVEAGGNALTSARVLRALGHDVALGAVLGDHPAGTPLEECLLRAGVDLGPARRVTGMPPISCILLHRESGSRTIVHHRPAPEYSLEDFLRADLPGCRWIHLEARPGRETARMVHHLSATAVSPRFSLEVEKDRPGIEECFPPASVVLFSRGYVRSRGHERPEPFLRAQRKRTRGPLLVVAWGEAGAWGIDADGVLHHAPAFPPERVVDTVGAGDTFNAGVIDALVRGLPPNAALERGCRLAGRKVGQVGLDGLSPG